MSADSEAAKQRRTAHGSHCKPVHHDNALANIGPEALLLLRRQGAELVIAEGRTLRAFTLTREHGHVRAHPTFHAQLPAPALGIADIAAGVVVAWNAEDRTALALVREGAVSQTLAVPGSFSALAAGGADAMVAVRAPDGPSGRLLRIDMTQRAILSERPLTNAAVDLQADPTGRWLTVTDRTARTVCTVPRTLETWPAPSSWQKSSNALFIRQPAPAQADAGANPAMDHRESCCLPHPCCCPKCAPTGGGQPPNGQQGGGQQNGGQQPGGLQPGGSPSGGPGQGGCQPGTSGAPGNNGGSITGQGGHVGQQGGDGQAPCWVDLLWPIHRLVRTSGYAVAVDAAYRNMAVIGLNPFRIVDERHFGRYGFRCAVDREAPAMMVMHLSTTGSAPKFEMLHLDAIDHLADPIHWLTPSTVVDDSAIFHGGLQIESLMSGAADSKGPINILILPVIEGTQTYSDPDLPNTPPISPGR